MILVIVLPCCWIECFCSCVLTNFLPYVIIPPSLDLHQGKEDHHLHSHGVQMCGLRIRSERLQDGTTNQTSQGNERLNDASSISCH